MKKRRTILFRIGAILILLVIAAAMMLIGRGHTVYVDNVTMDYEGQTYKAPYKVVVLVGGEQVAKLRNKERGMATCIGQKFTMTLKITQEKGGDEVSKTVTLELPYNMDGIVINLPGYLAGLPEAAYLSKFVPMVEETEPESDVPPADEFNLGDI